MRRSPRSRLYCPWRPGLQANPGAGPRRTHAGGRRWAEIKALIQRRINASAADPTGTGGVAMHEVSLVEEPERRVIGLGHRGAYAAIGPVFRAVSEAIEARGLWPEMLEFLGVYRDDP